MDNGRTPKFLGMSKIGFLAAALLFFMFASGALAIALALQVASNREQLKRTDKLAIGVAEVLDATHRKDCAQKKNTGEAIKQTERFLENHPGPNPLGAATREELIAGLERQRAFLKTFAEVKCEE